MIVKRKNINGVNIKNFKIFEHLVLQKKDKRNKN